MASALSFIFSNFFSLKMPQNFPNATNFKLLNWKFYKYNSGLHVVWLVLQLAGIDKVVQN